MVRCSFQGIHLLNTVNDVLTLLCQRCPGTAPHRERVVDVDDLDEAEVDFMEVGTPLHAALVLQADELAAERGTDINAIAKDFDDADPVYTSDLVLGRVVRELHGRGAMARLVDFGWSFSAERLVRPDIVEVDQPSIAVALLRSTRASRSQIELSQVSVHPLVAAIVLRHSRTRTNQTNAERHQPGGEQRKPAARPRANEGRSARRAARR